MMHAYRHVRSVFVLAFWALLTYAIFLTLKPFFEPIAWAGIVVLTTWPVFTRLERRFPGRPKAVALLMTLLLALVVIVAVVPLLLALGRELENLAANVKTTVQSESFHLPSTVASVPFIGRPLAERIQTLQNSDVQAVKNAIFGQQLKLLNLAAQAAQGVAVFGLGTLMCLFTTFFLYLHGAELAHQITHAAHKIGGEQFIRLLEAVRQTLRGAFFGVVATAFAQGVLAGAGFLVVGAPTPLVLGMATTVLSFIPLGAPLVYLPAAAYIAVEGRIGAAVFLTVWGIGIVSMADNVLRPLFISQSTNTSLLLVFMGVIGGLLAFGLIGIFIGPTVIGVAQVLWLEWVGRDARPSAPLPSGTKSG